MYNNMYRVFWRKVSGRSEGLLNGICTVSGRKWVEGWVGGIKDESCCYLVFSLRCQGTCRAHGILRQEGRGREGGADGFSFLAFGDGDSNTAVDGDGGDGGDGPGKRDNRNRQT